MVVLEAAPVSINGMGVREASLARFGAWRLGRIGCHAGVVVVPDRRCPTPAGGIELGWPAGWGRTLRAIAQHPGAVAAAGGSTPRCSRRPPAGQHTLQPSRRSQVSTCLRQRVGKCKFSCAAATPWSSAAHLRPLPPRLLPEQPAVLSRLPCRHPVAGSRGECGDHHLVEPGGRSTRSISGRRACCRTLAVPMRSSPSTTVRATAQSFGSSSAAPDPASRWFSLAVPSEPVPRWRYHLAQHEALVRFDVEAAAACRHPPAAGGTGCRLRPGA